MEIVNIQKAKTHLSALINRVLKGEKIMIARNNDPLVELKAINNSLGKRKFGRLKGKIWVADDCWDQDKDLEDRFYEGNLFPDENSD